MYVPVNERPHCTVTYNIVSHWLGACTKWSLFKLVNFYIYLTHVAVVSFLLALVVSIPQGKRIDIMATCVVQIWTFFTCVSLLCDAHLLLTCVAVIFWLWCDTHYRQASYIRHTKSQNLNVFHCWCPIHWRQVWNWERRCSWRSSADRWCSNYIWVINNFIA